MYRILQGLPDSSRKVLKGLGWDDRRISEALSRQEASLRLAELLRALEEEPYFGKITPPRVVSRRFSEFATSKGHDLRCFRWVRGASKPSLTGMGFDHVPVLTACLGSLEETLHFAWEWIATNESNRGMLSDCRIDFARVTIAPVPSGRSSRVRDQFRPWTLAWRVLQRRYYVESMAQVGCSSGLSTLFLAAQHPRLIESRDFARLGGLRIEGRSPHLWGPPGIALDGSSPERGYEYEILK